jgi:NIMA (never in mitosis gene a)-related kinase 1/4/5
MTKNLWVKLGDFGIAKVLEHTKDIAKTVVGTPYYLSPEIIENKPYSFSSDIWSLGVLLYEMCSLRPPFDAGSLHELARKILKGKYPPLPKFYSDNMQ